MQLIKDIFCFSNSVFKPFKQISRRSFRGFSLFIFLFHLHCKWKFKTTIEKERRKLHESSLRKSCLLPSPRVWSNCIITVIESCKTFYIVLCGKGNLVREEKLWAKSLTWTVSSHNFLIFSSFKQYNIKKKEEIVEVQPQEEPNPLMRKKKTPEELAAEAEQEDLDDFTSKYSKNFQVDDFVVLISGLTNLKSSIPFPYSFNTSTLRLTLQNTWDDSSFDCPKPRHSVVEARVWRKLDNLKTIL